MRGVMLGLAAPAALLSFAACSSERSVGGASTTSPAAVSTSAAPTTTTGAPATTAATVPASTQPATTPAPTTPLSPGWTVIDPATVDAPLAFPCCASNWYGTSPSPALPAAGQPLADGAYRIVFDWPADTTQLITATVHRFEQCSALPAGSCEDVGGPYAPEEIGVDEGSQYALTFSLDASIRVVLGGFTGGDGTGSFATGTGLDLAELIEALDADYQAAILDPIAGGASKDDVIAGLVASPAYGFAAPPEQYAGAISYTYASAPPLLFQGLPGVDEWWTGDRGSDVIGRISLLVSGGRLQLQVYAGFYS